MGNEAAKLAAPEDAERYISALSGVEVNTDPARAFSLDGAAARAGARTPPRGEAAAGELGQQGNAAACEELLAEMWRRRSAVEHALRVASELYAEAEAAAMQTYAHSQHRAGGAPHAWWKEQGPPQRPTLTASQREEVIARLLSERAALAEADLLVYARHSAAWSEFIALNPLAAAAAAQLARQDRLQSVSPTSALAGATAVSPDPVSTQAIRDGRRYLYSSPLRPLVGRGPSPQADSPQGAGNAQELASVREELLRSRRRCVELARAEREAREELQSLVASHATSEAAAADMRPELLAAEAGLANAVAAIASVTAQAAAEREAMLARITAMRNQLTLFREATEQLRWDASAASESVAGEKARLLERCAAIEAETQTVLSTAVWQEPASLNEEDEACRLRAALSDAEARCASLRSQRDAAVARASAVQTALTTQTADATDALERLAAAERAAAAATAAQRAMEISAMHAAEAARASAAERAALAQANVALQSQLDEVRRSLRKLPTLEPGAPPAAPSVASTAPRSEVDWMSEAGGFSESGSAFGDGADLAALRVRRERQREEARARAMQNRVKFEAIKAERNALKAETRRSATELSALRAEAARVQELQAQLRTIQSSLFL